MLVSTVLALTLGATGAPPEAKLHWHEAPVGDHVVSQVSNSLHRFYRPGRVPGGYKAPAGMFGPKFFYVSGRNGYAIVGVVARSKVSGPFDRGWIDWNHNGTFEKSEGAFGTGKSDPRWGMLSQVLEYPKPPTGLKGPVHSRITVVGGQFAVVTPTGYKEGTLDINGKPVKVILIEPDCDVRSDFLAWGNSPPAPIAALIQLDDGTFWRPVIENDESRIRFEANTNPTGVIEFAGAEPQSVDLWYLMGPVAVRPVGAKITLPAGTYKLVSGQFAVKNGSGATWQYMGMHQTGKELTVSAGATTTVKVGGPFDLSMYVMRAGASYSFKLDVGDACGMLVQGVFDEKLKRPAPPRLAIADSAGKVVKVLSFAYG